MSKYTAELSLKLNDQFSRGIKSVERNVKRISQSTSKSLKQVQRLSNKTAQVMKKIRMPGGALGGMVSAAAVGMEIRRFATLEERYARLGIQAGLSDEKIAKMKHQIESASSELKLDPKEVLAGIEQIVEKTGDLDFARQNIKNIALAMQATGAMGTDIGATLAEFQKGGLTSTKEVQNAIDTLILQGKEGAFTMENFATQSSRLFPAIGAYGFSGQKAIQQVGTLSQVARMGTGSAEQAATAVENILINLSSRRKDLEAAGISYTNEDGSLRDVTAVLKDLINKTNGDVGWLVKVLGSEGYRGVSATLKEYGEQGSFSAIDKFLSIQGNGSEMKSDAYRMTRYSSSNAQEVINKKDKVVDKVLEPTLKFANTALDTILLDSNKVLEDIRKNTAERNKLIEARMQENKVKLEISKPKDLKVKKVETNPNVGLNILEGV